MKLHILDSYWIFIKWWLYLLLQKTVTLHDSVLLLCHDGKYLYSHWCNFYFCIILVESWFINKIFNSLRDQLSIFFSSEVIATKFCVWQFNLLVPQIPCALQHDLLPWNILCSKWVNCHEILFVAIEPVAMNDYTWQ
jgi:hypothetical protein